MSVLAAITGRWLKQGIRFTQAFAWTGYRRPMPQQWTYFKDAEIRGLDYDFVAKLDKARHIAAIPFIITSGLRTFEKNKSVIGAVADSAHLRGLAVDLRARTSNEVGLIVSAAWVMGITRIGIYIDKDMQPRHVHLDSDPEKVPNECIFVKQEVN